MIKIITDATNDLSVEYLQQNSIHLIPMDLNIDGQILVDDKTLNLHNFYKNLRDGKLPTTSMINPSVYEEIFEKYLSQGFDILYIGFSSGLSGSFNASNMAAKTLKEKYSGKVVCFDSQSASLGMGILVKKAVEMKNDGKSLEEIIEVLTNLKDKITIFLGVDNLFHLQRGGRISKAAAIVRTALQLKPIIKVDENGKLVSFKKVMGRKKLIQTLVDYVLKYLDDNETSNVYVLHSDAEKDALELKTKLDSLLNLNVEVVEIGTIIGSHTGAESLAVIFVSKEDKNQIK
ncbi:MAG: DegV family protein [Clostridiales bacterium]|nr:DegV family protein [Clostridiales bacterium]